MTRTLVEAAFWAGPLVTAYVYAGFPALMRLVGRNRRLPRPSSDRAAEPGIVVTVIIPAYNEERHIEARIRNILESDYPRAQLDVIVVSDASTDRTDEIARSFAGEGVRLLVQEVRRGKTAGLNAAVRLAHGDIVVFTDANSAYPRDTISTLVRYFEDPAIGLVTGYTKYTRTATGEVADASNAYAALELAIKRGESRWGCCVGADGAVFAMRRSLYHPLRDDDINDLVLPLSVIDQGYECLLAESAFCSESPGKSVESEFRRQSRITNRSLRAIWRHAHLLNPLRFPMFSLFLFSHKVLRFLAPVLLSISAVSLLVLAARGGLYLAMAIAVLAGALLIAAVDERRWPQGSRRGVRLLRMFGSMNLAILAGWWKFLSGNPEVTWQHDRVLSR